MALVQVPGGASAPELRAHLAVPTGAGPWPAVLVLHEAMGLTADIKRQADRLARDGYLALALDLYTAGGPLRCLLATFRAMRSGHGKAVDDIEAARSWLASRPDSTGKVGVIGFCQGGGFALLAATRGFDAAAPNYGPLPSDPDVALRGACPIVASYGAGDRMFPHAGAELEAALARLDVVHDVKTYPGVGHSFLNDHGRFERVEGVLGLGFDEAVAADAWRRILAFFHDHLGGPVPPAAAG